MTALAVRSMIVSAVSGEPTPENAVDVVIVRLVKTCVNCCEVTMLDAKNLEHPCTNQDIATFNVVTDLTVKTGGDSGSRTSASNMVGRGLGCNGHLQWAIRLIWRRTMRIMYHH